ncbi:Multidrug resistance-associated protein 7 [Entophlyctis luteolus]|nr:Multidrug resistance-associated protein 7 [Entophlyctis luteolus]KAJ3384734.1 Multidrug resistance-associated protein 7 [Entophlyctis sp. JEL0112]
MVFLVFNVIRNRNFEVCKIKEILDINLFVIDHTADHAFKAADNLDTVLIRNDLLDQSPSPDWLRQAASGRGLVDLPDIGASERSTVLASWLDPYVAQTKDAVAGERIRLSLFMTLLPRLRPILIVDALAQLGTVVTTTLQSVLIQQLLKFLEAENGLAPAGTQIINNGYGWAVIMLALYLLNALTTATSSSIGNILQVRVKGAIVNAVYRKALLLSPKARSQHPPGKINSLVGSDMQAIMNLIESANKLWAMPVQFVIVIYFLSTLLGVSTAVVLVLIIVLGATTVIFAPTLNRGFERYMKSMDKRTAVLREFLYGVKVIKYQGLEEHQEQKILEARQIQINALYNITWCFVIIVSLIIFQSTLSAPLAFLTYSLLGNQMNSANIFPALSFLSTLVNISNQMPEILFVLAESMVSYNRISKFLVAEEANASDVPIAKSVDESNGDAIIIEDASFQWETVLDTSRENEESKDSESDTKTETKKRKKNFFGFDEDDDIVVDNSDVFKMENLSLNVKHGTLTAVVGSTGSGKSSLLAAIAGAMRKSSGEAAVYGTLSYCPQDPWIISGTIEENITLLDTTIESAVVDAVELCSLAKDVNSFPNGIKTQIGEKGINLSGGQRARISLARAIAKNADIYVLDDPLSALDAHVSKSVFDGAIVGMIRKSKTVIIATHLLHILPNVDQVVVMDDGKIVQIGAFSELIKDNSGKLFEIMKDYHLDDGNENLGVSKNKKELIVNKSREDEAPEAEDRESGSVALSVYSSYWQAIGWTWVTVQGVLAVLLVGVYVVQQLTLSAWSSDYWGLSSTSYLILYCVLAGVTSASELFNFSYTNFATINASQHFHNRALSGLMTAPMSFFNTQPVGRILNRMTADVRNLDNGFSFILNGLFTQVYTTLGM